MRLVCFRRNGTTGFGQVLDGFVHEIPCEAMQGLRPLLACSPSERQARASASPTPSFSLSDVELLPPVPNPAKVICVGLNYREHIEETGRSPSGYPTVFTRFADTQIGHGQPIVMPSVSHQLDYEGELAVIIGKPGFNIPEESALDHVGGYACYNDVSVRDWQKHGTQWTPGKNFPTTGPFGPWLVTADEIPDPANLTIETRLNGVTVQSASTRQLIFPITFLISYISRFTALGTGDVICTGTPGGVGFTRNPPLFMKPGDVVEVEIEGLGVLRNGVVAEAMRNDQRSRS